MAAVPTSKCKTGSRLSYKDLSGLCMYLFDRKFLYIIRDVVALRAKPQKPVLQGQKTKQS